MSYIQQPATIAPAGVLTLSQNLGNDYITIGSGAAGGENMTAQYQLLTISITYGNLSYNGPLSYLLPHGRFVPNSLVTGEDAFLLRVGRPAATAGNPQFALSLTNGSAVPITFSVFDSPFAPSRSNGDVRKIEYLTTNQTIFELAGGYTYAINPRIIERLELDGRVYDRNEIELLFAGYMAPDYVQMTAVNYDSLSPVIATFGTFYVRGKAKVTLRTGIATAAFSRSNGLN